MAHIVLGTKLLAHPKIMKLFIEGLGAETSIYVFPDFKVPAVGGALCLNYKNWEVVDRKIDRDTGSVYITVKEAV